MRVEYTPVAATIVGFFLETLCLELLFDVLTILSFFDVTILVKIVLYCSFALVVVEPENILVVLVVFLIVVPCRFLPNNIFASFDKLWFTLTSIFYHPVKFGSFSVGSEIHSLDYESANCGYF